MNIQSPSELAHAVRDTFPSKQDLSPLPWQRQEPSTTLWWLTPSCRNPAYADGKLVFSLDKDSPRKALLGHDDVLIEVGSLFVGLNIEKGFGPNAGILGPPRPKPDELLGPLWVWNNLVDASGSMQFGRTLAALSRSVTTHLYIISSTARDDDDTRRDRPCDAILYLCTASGITKLLDNGFREGVLNQHGIDTASTFEALAYGLRKVDDFHWVDVYAGTYISKGEVDLEELDGKLLSYFDHWVRSGYPPHGQSKGVVKI